LLVEAGAKPATALREYSTWPVVRSVTSTPSCEPKTGEPTTGPMALATPAAVAAAWPLAEPVAVASAAPGPGTVADAMRGFGQRARRAGMSRLTVTPAAIVKAHSTAIDAEASPLSRRTGRLPFATRCLRATSPSRDPLPRLRHAEDYRVDISHAFGVRHLGTG